MRAQRQEHVFVQPTFNFAILGTLFFHEEFDDWAASFEDPWSKLDNELAQDDPNLHLGPASFLSPYNWDSDKRLEHMNSEGIAAEVV